MFCICTELGLPAPALAVSAVATSNSSALLMWTPAAIGVAEGSSAPQFRVRYAGPADSFFYSVPEPIRNSSDALISSPVTFAFAFAFAHCAASFGSSLAADPQIDFDFRVK